jgi:putative transcription factor
MPCEMCGKEGELFRSKVEGTILNVCQRCSGFGTVLGEVNLVQKSAVYSSEPVEERVVQDYANIVKKAREIKGLKQEELGQRMAERESVISKVESGALRPSLKLARRFEKALGISLVEEDKKIGFSGKIKSGAGLTIGDLLKK